jgi:hypothetical protein
MAREKFKRKRPPPASRWQKWKTFGQIAYSYMYPETHLYRVSITSSILSVPMTPSVNNYVAHFEMVLLAIQDLTRASTVWDVLFSLTRFYVSLNLSQRMLQICKQVWQIILDYFLPKESIASMSMDSLYSKAKNMKNPFSYLKEFLSGNFSDSDSFGNHMFVLVSWFTTLTMFKDGLSSGVVNNIKGFLKVIEIRRPWRESSSILDSFLYVCEGGWQLILHGDCSWIHSRTTYSEWYKNFRSLQDASPRAIDSRKDPNYPDLQSYLRAISECRTVSDDIISRSDTSTSIGANGVKSIRDAQKQLLLMQREVKKYMVKKVLRREPFGIVLQGEPGVGKSNLAQWFYQTYGEMFSLPTGANYQYTLPNDDKFMSGFDTEMWCAILDDIDCFHTEAFIPETAKSIISIFNNVTRLANLPDLPDKGVNPIAFELAIVNTNHVPLKLRKLYVNAQAVNRRLKYVVEVRLKRGMNDGTQVKAFDNLNKKEVDERYTFRFLEFKEHSLVVDGKDKKERKVVFDYIDDGVDYDVTGILCKFRDLALHHRSRQDQVLDNAGRMEHQKLCPTCNILSTFCEHNNIDPELPSNPISESSMEEHENRWCTCASNMCDVCIADLVELAEIPNQMNQLDLEMEEEPPLSGEIANASIQRGLEYFFSYYIFLPVIPDFLWSWYSICVSFLFNLYPSEGFFLSVKWIFINLCLSPIRLYHYFDPQLSVHEEELERPSKYDFLGYSYYHLLHILERDVLPSGVLKAYLGSEYITYSMSKEHIDGDIDVDEEAILKLGDQNLVGNYGLYVTGLQKTAAFIKSHGTAILGAVLLGSAVVTVSRSKHPEPESPSKTATPVIAGNFHSWANYDDKAVLSNKQRSTHYGDFLCRINASIGYIISETPTGLAKNMCLHLGGGKFLSISHAVNLPGECFVHYQNSFAHIKMEWMTASVEHDLLVFAIPQWDSKPEGLLPYFQAQPFPHDRIVSRAVFCSVTNAVGVSPTISSVVSDPALATSIGKFSYFNGARHNLKGKPHSVLEIPNASYIPIRGERGQCGSPLISVSACVITGILIATPPSDAVHKDFSFFTTVTGEILNEMLSRTSNPLVLPETPNLSDPSPMYTWRNHGFPPLRALDTVRSTYTYLEPHEKINIRAIGTYKTPNSSPNPKDVYKNDLLFDTVREVYPAVDNYGPPRVKGSKDGPPGPFKVGLRDMGSAHSSIPREKLRKAANNYLDRFRNNPLLTRESIMQPLTIDEAINGKPGIKGMKLSTSTGFPTNCPKKQRLIFDPTTKKYSLNARDEAIVRQIISNYEQGIPIRPVGTGCIKIEIRKKGKPARFFTASNWHVSIVIRMYLLPLITFMMEHPELAESAVGVNTFSKEWETIYNNIKKHLKCGDIDYKKYDKDINLDEILTSGEMCVALVSAFGNYSVVNCLVIYAIFNDLGHLPFIVKGDLYLSTGINHSGHPLTVFLNCLVNSLRGRVVVFDLCGYDYDFNKNVVWHSYGDDVLASFDESFPYTPEDIKRVFASYNITVTSADKSDVMQFIPIDTVTFLKRRFFKRDKFILDPKELTSTACMLAWNKKGALDDKTLTITKLIDAEREALRLPESEFTTFTTMLDKCWSLVEATPPEWVTRDYDQTLIVISKVFDGILDIPSYSEIDFSSELLEGWDPLETPSPPDFSAVLPIIANSECVPLSVHRILTEERNQIDLIEQSEFPSTRELNHIWQILLKPHHTMFTNTQTHCTAGLTCNNTPSSLEEEQCPWDVTPIIASSTIGNSTSENTQVTMTMVDSAEQTEQSSPGIGADFTDGLAGHQNSQLAEFLSRPVLLLSENWTHGAAYSQVLDIWALYFANTAVLSKITNYSLIRAKMNVKVMLNGSPFHMGRIHVGYLPVFNSKSFWIGNPAGSNFIDSMIIQQLPGTGACPLAPNKNGIFEMEIPFFNDVPFLEVTDLPTTLGDLHLDSAGILLDTANGNIVDVGITVIAWLTDVELLIPTAVAASGEVAMGGEAPSSTPSVPTDDTDELKPNATISTISTAVAAATGKLSGVPVIGPYMSAISGASGMFGKAAALFGFSRPPVLTDPILVKNSPFSRITHTDGAETVQRLTFDVKNQITVDPSTTGLPPIDSMSVKTWTDHWSLVNTFPWEGSDVAGSQIYSINVNPYYVNVNSDAGGDIICPTALAGATVPFKYWNGGIEHKFVCCSTQFFSGRLVLTFDPQGQTHNITNTNDQYALYMDLSDADEIAFRTSWAQPKAYQLLDKDFTSINADFTTVYNATTCNGNVSVQVQNPLVGPDVNPNMFILHYVRAAPDFQLAVPDEVWTEEISMLPVASSGDVEVVDFVGASNQSLKAIQPQVYYGEAISSWRALCHRYNIHHSSAENTFVSISTPTMFKFDHGAFPAPRTNSTVTGNFNYGVSSNNVNNLLMTYLRGSYAGWRGGIRHKFVLGHAPQGVNPSLLIAVRDPLQLGTGGTFAVATRTQISLDGKSVTNLRNMGNLWLGAAAEEFSNQPVIEWEVPFYSDRKFCTTDLQNTLPNSGTYSNNPEIAHASSTIAVVNHSTAGNATVVLGTDMIAAGEDFDLLWFLGASPFRLFP